MKNKLVFGDGGGRFKYILEAAECVGWQVLGVLSMPEETGKGICYSKVIGTNDAGAFLILRV